MNWLKEVAKVGLEVGVGVATGGAAAVPKIVDEAVSHLGRKEDPSRGAAFAAAGIREILAHTVPDEALAWIDRFCVRWAQLVGSVEAMKDETLEILKGYEGFSGTPYLDTAGHRSIGYGHNLDVSPLSGERDYNSPAADRSRGGSDPGRGRKERGAVPAADPSRRDGIDSLRQARPADPDVVSDGSGGGGEVPEDALGAGSGQLPAGGRGDARQPVGQAGAPRRRR